MGTVANSNKIECRPVVADDQLDTSNGPRQATIDRPAHESKEGVDTLYDDEMAQEDEDLLDTVDGEVESVVVVFDPETGKLVLEDSSTQLFSQDGAENPGDDTDQDFAAEGKVRERRRVSDGLADVLQRAIAAALEEHAHNQRVSADSGEEEAAAEGETSGALELLLKRLEDTQRNLGRRDQTEQQRHDDDEQARGDAGAPVSFSPPPPRRRRRSSLTGTTQGHGLLGRRSTVVVGSERHQALADAYKNAVPVAKARKATAASVASREEGDDDKEQMQRDSAESQGGTGRVQERDEL
jgi:hypothetical protein